jgi:hypothetical protein
MREFLTDDLNHFIIGGLGDIVDEVGKLFAHCFVYLLSISGKHFLSTCTDSFPALPWRKTLHTVPVLAIYYMAVARVGWDQGRSTGDSHSRSEDGYHISLFARVWPTAPCSETTNGPTSLSMWLHPHPRLGAKPGTPRRFMPSFLSPHPLYDDLTLR